MAQATGPAPFRRTIRNPPQRLLQPGSEIELLRQWLADNDSVVEDLRRRLDRATALLADPRPIAEPVERVVEPLRTLRGEFLARRVGR